MDAGEQQVAWRQQSGALLKPGPCQAAPKTHISTQPLPVRSCSVTLASFGADGLDLLRSVSTPTSCCVCFALQLFSGNAAAVMATLGAAKACGVVGLVAAVASMFKPNWAPFTAPTYALCKGVAMAGMSAVLEMSYPGEL